MLNRCEFIGNLGRDPEMRYTASGAAMTSFSMAVSRVYNVEGERREDTEWVNVVCWNKLAELVQQHLTKGRKVFVEGRLSTRSWEGNDGVKKYRTEIIANQVLFLDPSRGDGPRNRHGEGGDWLDEDDVPFEP